MPPAHGQERIFAFQAEHHDLDAYRSYVSDFDPLSTDEIKPGLWRHLAEHVIFTVAPVIGGCKCTIRLEPSPQDVTFARLIAEIDSGRMLSYPVATFPELVRDDSNVLLSDPILGPDEFYVGLYTHESRRDILEITDLDQIRKLRFVVASNWDIDRQVLAERGFTTVTGADFESALRMLWAGRADVMLQPFATGPGMSFLDAESGESFYPIAGVKMLFPHGRAYMVSATHPQSAEFLGYLNAGLHIMRARGQLRTYLEKAGVIDRRIAGFRDL